MIAPGDAWGPFRPDIEPGERIARLRCLMAIAHLCCGPRGAELVSLLQAAEADADALPDALTALDRLAALDRRKILGTYAALTAPTRPLSRSSNRKDRA